MEASERVNLDTGKLFGDGEHILYVNGEYQGNSDIGKLMYDFSCTDTGDMNFELTAKRTQYLKENLKGVSGMCKIIKDMRREEREEGIREGVRWAVLRMLEAGKYALEEIADISCLSLDEVKKLQAEQNA